MLMMRKPKNLGFVDFAPNLRIVFSSNMIEISLVPSMSNYIQSSSIDIVLSISQGSISILSSYSHSLAVGVHNSKMKLINFSDITHNFFFLLILHFLLKLALLDGWRRRPQPHSRCLPNGIHVAHLLVVVLIFIFIFFTISNNTKQVFFPRNLKMYISI
jgi:hypothetical protein